MLQPCLGVVLIPDDFTLADWPERAAKAGLNTIALHHSSSTKIVESFVASDRGQSVIERSVALGLQVEYELHAMRDLLPRELFDRNPEMFRMNAHGDRTPDANCCAYSASALDVIVENAVALCSRLRPTTSRYFLWGDDGAEGCQCPQCAGLSFSDQAVLLENHMLAALRKNASGATLAHLAYEPTFRPPTQIKPSPGIFLEFAPIRRSYDKPLAEQPEQLEFLDANIEWFGTEGAQALEYWIDVSLFTHWKRPCAKLPDRGELIAADVATYAARGLRSVTSFGVMLDAEYAESYGELPLADYADGRKAQL